MADWLYVNGEIQQGLTAPQTGNDALAFHRQLEGYEPTPLVDLPSVASELEIGHVLVKDESSRLGLPSFKILGASYGLWRALCQRYDVPSSSPSSDAFASIRQCAAGLVLTTATDGNHGRALARSARPFGLASRIYVPNNVDAATKALIRSESGVEIVEVDGDYDSAVSASYAYSKKHDALFIQDTAFEGYEQVPGWIVDGYASLLDELNAQANSPTHILCPVGVGSLCQAVVRFAKSLPTPCLVIAVEPSRAGCLHASLVAGTPTTIATKDTCMTGMCCGTVSSTAWPVLEAGVDAAVLVEEEEAHAAVQELASLGVDAGPCGASVLAALRKGRPHFPELGIKADSVVVLLSTEGSRDYRPA